MSEGTNNKNTLHTILLFVMLGVLSWMAYTTQSLSNTVARFDERLTIGKDVDAAHEIAITELRTRITSVEIQFATFKAQMSKP